MTAAEITPLIIYHNAVELTQILNQLRADGKIVLREDVETLSSYTTRHIRRFGDYILDTTPPTDTVPNSGSGMPGAPTAGPSSACPSGHPRTSVTWPPVSLAASAPFVCRSRSATTSGRPRSSPTTHGKATSCPSNAPSVQPKASPQPTAPP